MNATELMALLALTTAASFTPGPNTTLSTALAANYGLKRAMTFVCAVPVGWGLLFSLCAGGVGALVVAVPALRLAIKVLGVGYLLWLAYKIGMARTIERGRRIALERHVFSGCDAAVFEHQSVDVGAGTGGRLDGRQGGCV